MFSLVSLICVSLRFALILNTKLLGWLKLLLLPPCVCVVLLLLFGSPNVFGVDCILLLLCV